MRKFIFIIFAAALALAAMLTVGNVLAASHPQQAAQPGVVVGFDFEDGTLQGWQTLTDTSFITNVAGITFTLNNDPAVGYQSTRSLRLTITDTNVNTTTLGGAGVQTVTTGSAITSFVRISNINLFGGTYGGAAIVVLDANGGVHIGDIAPVLAANQWVQASIVLTQPYPGPYSIGVGVLIQHPAGPYNTNVWIDKVQWSDPVGGGTPTATAPPSTPTRTPTIAASPTISGPQTDRFSGFVQLDNGTPVAGAPLQFFTVHVAGRDATPLALATSDPLGHWSFQSPLTNRATITPGGGFYGYDVLQVPPPPGLTNLRVDIDPLDLGRTSEPPNASVRWRVRASSTPFSSIDAVRFIVGITPTISLTPIGTATSSATNVPTETETVEPTLTATRPASSPTVAATGTTVVGSPTAAATGTIIAGTPTLTATGTTVAGKIGRAHV